MDNDALASRLRADFERRGVFCVNLISGPGAGKTSLLERTLQTFVGGPRRAAVLVADVQSERDVERLARFGFLARRIAGGGAGRQIDAAQVGRALAELPLDPLDLLFIETVVSPDCPAVPDLGEQARVVVLSVAETGDRPAKFASILRDSRLLLLHKLDIVSYTKFDVAGAEAEARTVNPSIDIIHTSSQGSPGPGAWLEWLDRQLAGRHHAQV